MSKALIGMIRKKDPHKTYPQGVVWRKACMPFLEDGADYIRLHLPKGWLALPLIQDAAYLGMWFNPQTLETIAWFEGDLLHSISPDKATLVKVCDQALHDIDGKPETQAEHQAYARAINKVRATLCNHWH